jgi:hypothetical protein
MLSNKKGEIMKNLSRTIKLGFLVAGSLSVITTALLAEDLPNRGPIEFLSYDTNKDGFISEKEFKEIRGKKNRAKIIYWDAYEKCCKCTRF